MRGGGGGGSRVWTGGSHHPTGCGVPTNPLGEMLRSPPRAPVHPGRRWGAGGGRTASSRTWLRDGKPGAFRADTSLLPGRSHRAPRQRDFSAGQGEPAPRSSPPSPPQPGSASRMELVRKKNHRWAENCKLVTPPAPGVATLSQRRSGDPGGARVLPRPSLQAGWLPSRAHRQLPLEKGTAAGEGPRPTRCPRQPRHTQRRGLATPQGQTIAPFTSLGGWGGEGCHLQGQSHGPRGAPRAGQPCKSRGSEQQRASPRRRQGELACNTRHRATLACGQSAR